MDIAVVEEIVFAYSRAGTVRCGEGSLGWDGDRAPPTYEADEKETGILHHCG